MSPVKLMGSWQWNEIRLGMYELGALSPKWRTKNVEPPYIYDWDG